MLRKEEVFQKIEASRMLPDLSSATQNIIAWLSEPNNLDIDEFAALVEKDKVLSELLLKHVNSDAFRLYKTISDTKEAVIFLGMEFVRNFLFFIISQQFFYKLGMDQTTVFNMRQYWKHILATSVAAELLGQRLGRKDNYTLFSYGLNHDIGMLVINTCIPEEIDKVTEKVFSGQNQIVAEKAVFGGITHADIGAWICKRWNFTPDIIRVVKYHHTPYQCKEDQQTLELMYLADLIGTEYYQKLLNIHSSMYINQKVLSSLGLTVEDQKEIGNQIGERVELLTKRFINL